MEKEREKERENAPFTEKERAIILSDYHRLRIENEEQSSALRIETDVILTEHPLDT